MEGLNPNLYTEDYYLADCSGFKEFKKSFGRKLGPRFKNLVKYINIRKGIKVLDIGCGRGELSFWAARQGAEVIGIDYSKAGIRLANEALEKQSKRIQGNVRFHVQNAKDIEFTPESFDMVLLIDILEHLYSNEQDTVLRKVHRILKKGGMVLAHTEPNRIYLDYTYPYWCYPMNATLLNLWKHLTGKKLPALPHPSTLRTESHKIMHINEPTYMGLKRMFTNAGFNIRIISKVIRLRTVLSWKDRLYNLVVFLHPLSRYFPLNALFANNFIIVAQK